MIVSWQGGLRDLINALANRLTAQDNWGPEGTKDFVLTSNGPNPDDPPPSFRPLTDILQGISTQGPKGDKGDTGLAGAVGPTGPAGPSGARPREVISFSTGIQTPGVWAIGSFTAPLGAVVYRISANHSCGVRLYNTAAARDADVAAARPRTTLPAPGSGVLAETWLAESNGLEQLQSTPPKVYNGDDPTAEVWYWAVMNTMLSAIAVDVEFLVVPSEIP